MATFLFNEIIFGPVTSRRLGESLGINLLPLANKYCNFNCLYCECGFTAQSYGKHRNELPGVAEVLDALNQTLSNCREQYVMIDTITFAGNGEPTLHPEFADIIDGTVEARNKYYPKSKIAVLSNATLIANPLVRKSLLKVDYNILKLDSVNEETVRLINCPFGNFSLPGLLKNLKDFRGNLTLQTLFIKGEYQGRSFDNSSDNEVQNWLDFLKILRPELVMIYTFRRDTPINTVQKISPERLYEIASKVEALGIQVSVSV